MNHLRFTLAFAILLFPGFGASGPRGKQAGSEWRSYGGDPGGMRYSPLDQINSKNVAQLQRAWTYHTGERGRAFDGSRIGSPRSAVLCPGLPKGPTDDRAGAVPQSRRRRDQRVPYLGNTLHRGTLSL